MMMVLKSATEDEIRKALEEVMDPEIPVLSVVDLGIIGDIEITGDEVLIKMIPTFTACPAIKTIQDQIKEKIVSLGFSSVVVVVDASISWNTNRLSEEGKRKLNRFGLGTPVSHTGNFSFSAIASASCPHCGSADTTLNSLFGSTLCRSMHFCFSCRQAFERFKPL